MKKEIEANLKYSKSMAKKTYKHYVETIISKNSTGFADKYIGISGKTFETVNELIKNFTTWAYHTKEMLITQWRIENPGNGEIDEQLLSEYDAYLTYIREWAMNRFKWGAEELEKSK